MSKSSSAAIRSTVATFFLYLGGSCDRATPDQRAPSSKEHYKESVDERIDAEAGDEAGVAYMSGNDRPEPHEHSDRCGVDAVLFEGECLPKAEVTLLVEKREGEALKNVHLATEPKDKIEATHDLIDQQVLQAQKTEKDLDEIILLLEREKALKEGFFEDPSKLEEPLKEREDE